MSIYVICVCLCIVMSSTYCVVFLFSFSLSCVPYIASFSGLPLRYSLTFIYNNISSKFYLGIIEDPLILFLIFPIGKYYYILRIQFVTHIFIGYSTLNVSIYSENRRGIYFQSPKTIKTWTTKHYASRNQWYNTE